MFKIAIDAMGGDDAPREIILGVNQAIREYKDIELYLFGDEEKINQYLVPNDRIKVFHTAEFLDMGEKDPIYQFRNNPDVSMFKAMRFVKEGNADAIVSAGPTQCLVVGGVFIIKRMRSMHKVAIAPIIPSADDKPRILLDAGGNVEAKPEHLLEFAIYASNVIKALFEIEKPKVGLLNIGTEEGKGRQLEKDAYELLKDSKDIEFLGNIEPKEILISEANVLVSDGFTANIVLKTIEGTAKGLGVVLKKSLTRNITSKLATGLFLKGSIKQFRRTLNPNEIGGAMILGLNNVVIKAHGSSNAYAFKNAIKQARLMLSSNIVNKVSNLFERIDVKDE